MKERPILFSAPMVRAILAGTKTQTRRDAKFIFQSNGDRPLLQHCPYGHRGDRLWVREAFRLLDVFDADSPIAVGELCLNAGYPKPWAPIQYEADGSRDNWMHVGTPPHDDGPPEAGKLRPGIHMPRWAGRILLEIVSVRVERLQDISEADAMAEGVDPYLLPVHPARERMRHVDGFSALWESINGPSSWNANPWVWVVEFKRVTP